ncbi:MAG: hypothetical protein ABI759_12365 [Candidatus Solibacter sp.]
MPSLEVRDYLTLLGFGVALYIAYLHRRQMRQIEAAKANSEAGLIPPPNPVRAFIQNNLILLVSVGNSVTLLHELFSAEPITRHTIFFMGLNFCGILIYPVFRIVDRLYDILVMHSEAQLKLSSIQKEQVDAATETLNLVKLSVTSKPKQ